MGLVSHGFGSLGKQSSRFYRYEAGPKEQAAATPAEATRLSSSSSSKQQRPSSRHARREHRRRIINPRRRVRCPATSRVAALPALKPSLTQLEFPGCDTETHVFLSTYYITLALAACLALSLALPAGPAWRAASGPDVSRIAAEPTWAVGTGQSERHEPRACTHSLI